MHDDEDGYSGPATLITEDDLRVPVDAVLSGWYEPVEGRYQWYGRVSAPELADLVGSGKLLVRLRTPSGEAVGEVAEPDLWGRFRISGTSHPPYHIATLEELEQ
jgi:uncharacterized protein DUF4873